MITAAFLTLLSHWWRHPFQLLAIVAGLALSTGLWSAVQAINAEARASYARAASQLGQAQADQLVADDGVIPLDTYVALRRAGWRLAPVLEGRIKLGTQSIDLMGIDLLNPPPVALLSEETGEEDEASDISLSLLPPGQLFLHPDTAASLPPVERTPPIVVSPNVPQIGRAHV